MRVAIVKQVLDTFGPWSSIRWEETSPEALFRIWPSRPLHWEMTTLLEADWYVIPQQVKTDYTYDSVLKQPGNADIVRKHTQNVIAPKDIPYDSYDLVITNDPILEFPRNTHTLFAYFVVEHWDRRYHASLRRPMRNADLFLAHMMDASSSIDRLPQAISFPYVRDPKTLRALFAPPEREEGVWADWRTLSLLCGATNGNAMEATKRAAQRLEEALRLPVAFRSFSMGLYHGEDPPRWGDAAEFLRELARQKYYLCLGRGSGAGQGLADAASLGCICFGEQDKPYHRLLCHPEALCGDLHELPKRVRRVNASKGLQEEIRNWQEEKLQRHFIEEPLALLGAAIERKRKTAASLAGAAAGNRKEPAGKNSGESKRSHERLPNAGVSSMRILALNFTEKGVGTYLRAFYFCRELARAGHKVTLATVSRTSRFRPAISYKRDWIGEFSEPRGRGPWIRLMEGPAWGNRLLPGTGWGPLDIWGRTRELETSHYDAVFGFEYQPNVSWPVYFTQRRKNYAFYSDWCDWFGGSSNWFRGWKIAHRIDSYFEEKIRFRASRVSVTSKVLQERALAIGIPKERLAHIPNGAATEYIVPLSKREARKRFDLPEDAPIVVAVSNGDMCREMRIFGEVLRQAPKSVFLLVGNVARPAWELAEQLAIDHRISRMGWVSDEDYPWVLGCADVCICPLEDSLNDRARWPTKILDFLTAGRATVTNPVGEVEALFRKSDVGVLAGHSDEEFAGEIVALFRAPERRFFLGEIARKVMVEEWDWRVRGAQIAGMMVA